MQGILEQSSLWYGYKTKVWEQKTPQTAVVHNIMRTLRCIRGPGNLAYVSVPITSGKFLYHLKLTRPDMGVKEQLETAIKHNYHEGWVLTEELQKRLSRPVLYPADLVPAHQEWEQAHFQALWLSIIAEKCAELHMSDGWEFSNGGAEEFTHAMQLQLGIPRHPNLAFWNTKEAEIAERERMRSIKVYDHKGVSLSLHDGIGAIACSLSWIKDKGFEAPKLENCLRLLRLTDQMSRERFYQ